MNGGGEQFALQMQKCMPLSIAIASVGGEEEYGSRYHFASRFGTVGYDATRSRWKLSMDPSPNATNQEANNDTLNRPPNILRWISTNQFFVTVRRGSKCA